jgi:hypothetical protein
MIDFARHRITAVQRRPAHHVQLFSDAENQDRQASGICYAPKTVIVAIIVTKLTRESDPSQERGTTTFAMAANNETHKTIMAAIIATHLREARRVRPN